MNRRTLGTVILGFILITSCSQSLPTPDFVEIDQIGYDPYGRDCGSVLIHVANASNREHINKQFFIKPSDTDFALPEGLVASGNNKLKFYGRFEEGKCIHLMSDGTEPQEELFFVYDSIVVQCPYQLWNLDNMQFESATCGPHSSFHNRIQVVEE